MFLSLLAPIQTLSVSFSLSEIKIRPKYSSVQHWQQLWTRVCCAALKSLFSFWEQHAEVVLLVHVFAFSGFSFLLLCFPPVCHAPSHKIKSWMHRRPISSSLSDFWLLLLPPCWRLLPLRNCFAFSFCFQYQKLPSSVCPTDAVSEGTSWRGGRMGRWKMLEKTRGGGCVTLLRLQRWKGGSRPAHRRNTATWQILDQTPGERTAGSCVGPTWTWQSYTATPHPQVVHS